MDNKELTFALMSCFLEKKISIKNIMETFDLTEDEAKLAIEELIKKDAIYNYDFTKGEMKCISKKELEDLIKNAGKDKSELFNEYCVYNENMSINGTLKEMKKEELNDITKKKILNVAVDVGIISTAIVQRALKMGYSRAVQYLDWLSEHIYIDDNSHISNVLISRDEVKRLYPTEQICNVPLYLFKAYEAKGKYKEYFNLLEEDKELQKKYYQNIQSTMYDDIISLSQEDFNTIPSSWLYDWKKVKGCQNFNQIEKMIDERKKDGIDI